MSKNSRLLASFSIYCREHPEMRFFQALRNWSGYDYIIAKKDGVETDTFYWEEPTSTSIELKSEGGSAANH
jgi:hypothetical protein